MYTAEISRNNPASAIFLLDRSDSMDELIAGGQITKAQAVADAVNKLLQNLVIKCSKGDDVRNYFDVGVIGYGMQTAPAVGPIFTGALAGKTLVTISDIATNPARLVERTKKVSDGDGGLVDSIVKSPIWFEPASEGGTPMTEAFGFLKTIIEPWIQQHQQAFPPIVIHVSDGNSTDGDPSQAAKNVQSLTTTDGGVLIFNCNISSLGGNSVLFPSSTAGISDPFAEMLFNISSVLPEPMAKAANTEGFKIEPGARGFAYQADLVELIQFIDIGTKPAQTNLR